MQVRATGSLVPDAALPVYVSDVTSRLSPARGYVQLALFDGALLEPTYRVAILFRLFSNVSNTYRFLLCRN